jgi:fatty acid desaturase
MQMRIEAHVEGRATMSGHARAHRLSPLILRELYQHTWYYNLKIPLFYGLLIGCGIVAWNTQHPWLAWSAYACMGYLWMSIVTFMHDCTHQVLFEKKWKNWAFGIFSTLPIFVTFIAFKEDHLEHHRYNRTSKDPDAFTMGERSFGDFVLFYAYMLVGVLLTVLQFNFIYSFQKFRGAKLWIHVGELALRVLLYTGLVVWTASLGVLNELLAVGLIPAGFFSLFNSVRFVAEHYATPWNGGQLLGTRTILSNPVNRFFWNNINYHIGHHVYPAVPWYNLQALHTAMLPAIDREGAIVDSGYLRVFMRACLSGPETIERNAVQLQGAELDPVPVVLPG